MRERFAAWVEEYSLSLLRWARGKTGDPTAAEDLAQEVWLQFFSAVRREAEAAQAIAQPEHLLWKVARHVWLKSLRQKELLPLMADAPAPEDFAADIAQRQEDARLRAWVHQKIVNLNRLQREIFILYYVEKVPQKEIARRLGVKESTLRWHLSDTRRKIKEEADHMTDTEFVYRPRKLNLGINGQAVARLDTTRINSNLLMQNILLACYEQGRTAAELAEMLGVARPYIEHDITWLAEREFLAEEKGRYFTTFMISTCTQEHRIYCVYENHKAALSGAICRYLLDHEADIRRIGFTGCDKPMNKLLWTLIYFFTMVLDMPCNPPEKPYRPDGGRYWPLGFDRSDFDPDSPRANFAYNGGMCSDGFNWFGLHNFGQSEIEDMLDGWTPEYLRLRTLLVKLIHGGFDPSLVTEEEKFPLAQLIEKGFLFMEDDRLVPNFLIFTRAQHEQLCREIFAPLAETLQPEVTALARDLHALSLSNLPAHLKHLAPLAEAMAQHEVGYMTELLAFRDGTLYQPADKRDGEFLTMAYICR
ncbi:MAG: RNA polymerase sigma factor [Clostridia bacterium]|nr:RNA polymerase sigma factor [Clostridia bacterium]